MKNPFLWFSYVLAAMVVLNTPLYAETFDGRAFSVSDLRVDTSVPGPVIIALHPDGGAPVRFRTATGLNQTARALNAFVMYPTAESGRWDHTSKNSSDVRYLARLIRSVQADKRTLNRPVLLVGHGGGGAMAMRLACDVPDLVAGIGVVATKATRAVPCPRGKPKPAIFIHGTADPISDHDGGPEHLSAAQTLEVWSNRNRCSDDVRVDTVDQIRRDRTSVVTRRYAKCLAALDHVVILGGGHGWPTGRGGRTGPLGPQSSEINASNAVITFLAPLVRR